MPNETVLTAPPVAKLYARNYGYRVCMNKKISSPNERVKTNPLFQQLMADDEAERLEVSNTVIKKKKYAVIDDGAANQMKGRDLVRKLEKENLRRRERSELS